MKVYVVMANDFPDCVYTTEQMAEDWCVRARANNQQDLDRGIGRKIYYKIYPFDIIGELEGD